MQRCHADPFYRRENYEQSGLFEAKKYFQINGDLPAKYSVLLNAIPRYINSHCYQKISLVKSEADLASRLREFKRAVPVGKNGKFTCLVFDHSCTLLAEMHYGTPKNSKKYHEICLYSGQLDVKAQATNNIAPFAFESASSLSRFISETPIDLDDAEEQISEDDDPLFSGEQESPEPDQDFYSEFTNSYEKSITVEDRDGYNFIISSLPSLNQMKRMVSLGEEINPQFYAQVCGVSKSAHSAIQALFQTIRESLVSGCFDE